MEIRRSSYAGKMTPLYSIKAQAPSMAISTIPLKVAAKLGQLALYGIIFNAFNDWSSKNAFFFSLVTHLPESFKMILFLLKIQIQIMIKTQIYLLIIQKTLHHIVPSKNAETPVDDYIRCMITDIMSQHIFKNRKTYQLFLKHPWFGVS